MSTQADLNLESHKVVHDERVKEQNKLQRLLIRPEMGALIGAVGIFILFLIVAPPFRSPEAMATVLYASSTIGIMAVGVGLLMIGGEFDLSSGVAVTTSSLAASMLCYNLHLNLWAGAALALVVSLSVGFFNGYMVMKTKILFVIALAPAALRWEVLWWVLAALSMILGNVVAVAQTSLKRMLAYSSISHAGYALIGVVSAVQAKGPGVSSVLFYLFAYMFTTMGTFSMIILLTRQGFRGDHIADFAGLGRTHPLPAFIFIVFFLSLAGIPPTAGFVGKLLIFRAAIDAGFVWLAVIGVATSAIAAYYYFMVIKTMYMDEPTGAVALSSSRPLSVGLAIMVVATILLGLFPNLVLQATEVTRIVQ